MIDTLSLTVYLLLANSVVALVAFAVNLLARKKTALFYLLIMLLCPLVGPFFCYVSWLIRKVFFRRLHIDREDVTFSREQRKLATMEDYEESIALVPMEEAYLVANYDDRRKALLNKLKMDYDDNTMMIMQAVENEDVETAHYAASAIMHVNSAYTKNLRELSYQYEKNPADEELVRAYADYVLRYVESGILSALERQRYVFLYLDLIKVIAKRSYDQPVEKDDQMRSQDYRLVENDYHNAVNYYLEFHDGHEALKWCGRCMERFPMREQSYLNYLKSYYRLGMTEEFNEMLNALQASDIFLSDKGLDLIRFFRSRQQGVVG